MISKKLIILLFIIPLIFFTIGCNNISFDDKSLNDNKNVDNSQATSTPKDNLKSQNYIDEELQNKFRQMATEFIKAEYEGNYETLLNLSSGEARARIKNGELVLKEHKLDKIVSFNFIESDESSVHKLIVTISAYEPGRTESSMYFEHIWFEFSEDYWSISEVLRDI